MQIFPKNLAYVEKYNYICTNKQGKSMTSIDKNTLLGKMILIVNDNVE